MIDLSIIVEAKYPVLSAWSPDGGRLAYILGGTSGFDIMLYSIRDRASALLISVPIAINELSIINLRWSSDGRRIIFNKMQDFYEISPDGGEAKLLASVKLVTSSSTISPDLKNLAFVKDGTIWIEPIPDGEPFQVTGRIPGLEACGVVGGLGFMGVWSPDSKKMAVSAVHPGRDIIVVSIDGKAISWIDPGEYRDAHPVWSNDSSKVAFARTSTNGRQMQLRVASASGGRSKALWTVTDERWVGDCAVRGISWSHDNTRLAFVSNKDGYSHLYVVSLENGRTKQLTKGKYEVLTFSSIPAFPDVWNPRWSKDDSEIFFVSNRGSPHERHIWAVPYSGGEARKLSNMKGVSGDLELSPDGRNICFSYSGPTQTPSLWIVRTSERTKPTEVYTNLPEGLSEKDFGEMQPVQYESTDGTLIHGMLFTPKNRKNKIYPALVVVYGDGHQQALLGHSWYPMGVLADTYLASKGYVVLRIDPRGTCWYGRDFETAAHHEAGGPDGAVQDIADASKYLSGLRYVDSQRIGLIGLSYGAWMTALTLVHAPEAFRTGIMRGGIYDLKKAWEFAYNSYGGAGFDARWGDPRIRPDEFHKWSPVNHVNRLVASVLVIHGDADTNAPFSHSKDLVSALLRNEKDFDFIVYPDQPHAWTKAEVAKDFLLRVERFLDQHLKS
jgi:dipeptidyl aminopeptidase/acylaminoacyl peptidase